MKGCFKAVAKAIVGAVLLLGAGMLPSCTDVDDTLGLEMIPGDQDMIVLGQTITGEVDTYVVQTDSIATCNLRRMLFGSMKSDKFGTSRYSGIYQFLPRFNENFTESEEEQLVFDAAYLDMYINGIFGDTKKEQTFYVYVLTDTVTYDTTYMSTYDYREKVDLSKPVFRFTMKNELEGSVRKELESVGDDGQPGNNGIELMEYLINDIDYTEVMSEDDADPYRFHKLVPGFYIAPADDSPEDAAVYFVVTNDLGVDRSELVVAARVDTGEEVVEEEGEEGEEEIIVGRYTFEDNTEPWLNTTINIVEHDYADAQIDPAIFNDTIAGAQVREEIYVQNIGGPSGYLCFTDEFVAQLRDLKTYNGEDYRTIYMNRAQIYIPIADNNYTLKELAPMRLALYSKFKLLTPSVVNADLVSIPDYQYALEATTSYHSVFGGYLNWSKNRYEMDVSTYVRLLTEYDNTPRKLWLAAAYSHLYLPGEVSLLGAGNDPIKVEITYTLIK